MHRTVHQLCSKPVCVQAVVCVFSECLCFSLCIMSELKCMYTIEHSLPDKSHVLPSCTVDTSLVSSHTGG